MSHSSAIDAISTLALVAMLACTTAGSAQARTRGSTPEQAPTATVATGKYYALVIGINDYPAPLPKLKTAVNDAREIANVLTSRYGFDVKVMLDGDATRENILDSLNQYESKLTANDNLLIYYAGHGYENKLTGKAYWLPVNANSVNSSSRIIADDITSEMVVLPAKHILVISDSCYSGGLSRDADVVSATLGKDAFLRRMMSGRSRTLMASGGDEPVSDSGKDGHSIFAYALLQTLNTKPEIMFSAADVFYAGVQRRVAGNSDQVPHYDVIRNSSHDDGDFVFLRKGAAMAAPAENSAPAAEMNRTATDASSDNSPFHPASNPAQDLSAARATYYTPTTDGLQSFHCDVTNNWKLILNDVSADDPFLAWLTQVSISLDDNLKTGGKATWTSAKPPPADAADAENQIQKGLTQMLQGFMQTWNGYMNGSMVPEPDSSTTVTRNGDGVLLHAADANDSIDESFDRNMVLTESHVIAPNMDVEMYPTYEQTSDGKIVSSMRSVTRATNAPGTDMTMTVTYNLIDSFRIPATLKVAEKNVGNFEFTFANCSVKHF
jgi:hypothetical protein